MPFKSEAQRRWMHSKHPEMAKRWEAETPSDAKLPERAGRRARSGGGKKESRIQHIAKDLVNRRP